MQEILKNTNERKGKLECSTLYMSFIYGMILNRINRGYSAEELSFLLGKDDDYIEKMEFFEIVDFGTDLFAKLCSIFHPSKILLQSDECNSKKHYEITRWKDEDDGYIHYRMDDVVNNYEAVLVFKILEEDPYYTDRYTNSVKESIKQCQDALLMMIQGGLFEKPTTPHAIHYQVEYTARSRIEVRRVKKELDKLCGKKGKAPLKKTKRRSYGYRYIFHPDISMEQALVFAKQKFDEL